MVGEPGIYVAFDRFGSHFDYARHPDSHICTGRACEQAARIDAMTSEASRRGGKVLYLTLEEFDRLILANARMDDMRPSHNDIAA